MTIPQTRPALLSSSRRCDSRPCGTMALEQVRVSYDGQLAVGPVSLTIEPCAITALVGPSGCGKSSLLQCLNRLDERIEGCRTTGRILLDGESIHDRGVDVTALRRRIGLIFQHPNPFHFSIARNLDLPLRENGIRNAGRRREMARQALEDVGLWEEVHDRLKMPATALSGGQQQRLCMARALLLKPEILLMDEPCSALDPLSSERVEGLIQTMRGKYTMVLVTHNLAQARRVADRLAVMWVENGVGTIVEEGPAAEVFAAPRHPLAAAYLQGRTG